MCGGASTEIAIAYYMYSKNKLVFFSGLLIALVAILLTLYFESIESEKHDNLKLHHTIEHISYHEGKEGKIPVVRFSFGEIELPEIIYDSLKVGDSLFKKRGSNRIRQYRNNLLIKRW